MIMPRLRRTISSIVKGPGTAFLHRQAAGFAPAACLLLALGWLALLPLPVRAQPAPEMPASLRPLADKLAKEGEQNRVLNQMELGLAAFNAGSIDLARTAFDDVLTQIEKTHAGTEQAAKARSLWYAEGSKIFKGEPYERAMAYYYRGLIYLKEHDYDNARACFSSGILQDSFAEEEQFRSDFAVLDLLMAYACHLQGDLAVRNDEFKRFKELRPDFPEPDWDNVVLAVVETGKSPRKLSDGVGHYQMKIFRGKQFKDVAAELSTVGDQHWRAYPTEDIAFQAMTRGARPIDAINEGKVQFKRSAEKFGTTLTSVASEAMLYAPAFNNSGSVSAVAGGLGVIGAFSVMMAQNAKPHADTRYWHNLPDTVHVSFLPKGVRGNPFTVTFLDAAGSAVGRQEQALRADDVVLWFKNPY
jgi:tetratricopeptide (TPR) repeat protein